MPQKRGADTEHSVRQRLINRIEEKRNSCVLTYVLADRPAAQAQISEDAVRPMYDHLRKFEPAEKIDLFVYSKGGQIEVPWRIVTMIREFTDKFAVIVPYKAMSAATLTALGADEIVMGPKGELGAIDPQITIQRSDGGTAAQDNFSVEDVMSYIRFVRETVGLKDEAALAQQVNALTAKLPPWTLGQLNRIHSHIRVVAQKLLTTRGPEFKLNDQQIQMIIDTLAEKTHQHGHAIGRKEAREIGLNVVQPEEGLDEHMWELMEAYEEFLDLRRPIDPRTFVSDDKSMYSESIVMGCIESAKCAHHFRADLVGRKERQQVPQLNLNLNLSLQLPPNIDPQSLPQEAQNVIQGLAAQLQSLLPQAVQEEVNKQMPVTGHQLWTQNGAWIEIKDWVTAVPDQ